MRYAALVVLAACAARAAPAGPDVSAYAPTAARIVDAARADDGAYRKLSHLTDLVGPRLSGSAALERAVAWAVETLTGEGHENVRAETVMVTVWVRGAEALAVTVPVQRPLSVLALGGSSATPPDGLEAPLAVVASWAELDALGDRAAGKIILFNHPLPPYGPAGSGYRDTSRYRVDGPQRAADRGAMAALVRSVTARSLGSPHTGATKLTRPFPAATVSVEDAELLTRLAARGEVRVRLMLGAKNLPDAPSANVLAELVGRERPEEIVLIGAHLDSWDVGEGAHDDGAGCVMMMQALTTLRRLGLRPRRTIRVVLFTNEENGGRGGEAYAAAHAQDRHVAALEADSGGFRPEGFNVKGDAPFLDKVRAAASLLAAIDATRVAAGGGGSDIEPLGKRGVPLIGFDVDGATYFDYHHSAADTLDKVNAKDLALDVAAIAVVAYVLADM